MVRHSFVACFVSACLTIAPFCAAGRAQAAAGVPFADENQDQAPATLVANNTQPTPTPAPQSDTPSPQTVTLPDAPRGKPYNKTVSASVSGSAPFKYSVDEKTLPDGLSLDPNGTIKGAVSGKAEVKSYPIAVTVTDATGKVVAAVQGNITVTGSDSPTSTCWIDPKTAGKCGGPWLRTIVGFEQAGVSAAQSQQNFFFDLYYDRPLVGQGDDDLGAPFRSWGNLRISSVPQQITTDVATFASGFAAQVGQLKVNEVAQAFEFLGGVQYRLWASKRKPDDWASSDPVKDPEVHNRISINVILGGGVVTPLSPKQSVQLFSVPANQPDFFTRYPQAVGKQFVAFTLEDRDRFFRQAYGGFRLMTHFIGDKRVRAPETFDLTYGFNESVTGGRIHGGVMRLEGFVPIPVDVMSWVYLFGTGMFKPGAKATLSHPFLLDPAPTGTLPTDPNAVVIATPQADRDYYRVGVGIDLVDLISMIRANNSAASKQ